VKGYLLLVETRGSIPNIRAEKEWKTERVGQNRFAVAWKSKKKCIPRIFSKKMYFVKTTSQKEKNIGVFSQNHICFVLEIF
jgi:hypothetical protein